MGPSTSWRSALVSAPAIWLALAHFSTSVVSCAIFARIRRAADLLGLTAIAENVIDSDEPIDPAARILEPVRVGFPTADKSFVVDVIACTDIDQSRPLKHSQSGLQRGLAGIAPFGLALVNAGRQKHLIDRGKVADDIAAIIKLRKTAERRTHCEPADRLFAQAASHLSGTRCDRTLQDIVCALIERSDQRPVGTGPPRQRFEILDVDLDVLRSGFFSQRSTALSHTRGSRCCIRGS